MKRAALVLAALLLFAHPMSATASTPETIPSDVPRVHIVGGSDINLLASSSAIPVRIQNEFDVDVRIQLHAEADNARISVPEAIEVTVPAQSAITAKLPVTATGVGDVNLSVWLETFSGLNLNSKNVMHINVNPSAETSIVIGFGATVALLLTFGVIRTLRKRKQTAS